MINYKEVFQLARDKGFDNYFIHSALGEYDNNEIISEGAFIQEWLRNQHSVDVMGLAYTMEFGDDKKKYIWVIYKKESSTKYRKYFDTYQEAILEGINEALKYVQ